MSFRFYSIVKPVCSLVISGMLLQCLSFACLACTNAEAKSSVPMDCCPSQHSPDKPGSLSENCHDEIDYCQQTMSTVTDRDLDLSIFGFADLGLSTIDNSQTVLIRDPPQLAYPDRVSRLSGIPIYLACCSFLE